MRKLKYREVKKLAQGSLTYSVVNLNSNPGSLVLESGLPGEEKQKISRKANVKETDVI